MEVEEKEQPTSHPLASSSILTWWWRDMILHETQGDMLANLDDMSASVRSSLKQGEEGEWS